MTNDDITTMTTDHPAASFEIVFDNGGGAALQKHDGSIAIRYSRMARLAHDVALILAGDDASEWDGSDESEYIADEEYDKHAPNGGLYALQVDPEYRHNWPDPDEIGWNNVAEFIRALA